MGGCGPAPVVGPQQRVVVFAAVLGGQRAPQEVGEIGQRGSPRHGLPVDHRQRALGPGGAEQHIVQPVVAVHQAPDARLLSKIAVERGHQAFAHRPVLGRDLVAVALHETRVQRRDHGLVQRRVAVEPRRLRQRDVAEQRAVQPPQLDDPQPGLFDCGTGDFVANDGRSGVAQQQVEHAGRGVDGRVVAGRDRSAQPRRDVTVEADLPLVEAQRQAGLPADRIGSRHLEHHRLGSPRIGLRVAQPDPVALAHLAGADALDREVRDGAGADHRGQPGGAQVTGSFDDLLGLGVHEG